MYSEKLRDDIESYLIEVMKSMTHAVTLTFDKRQLECALRDKSSSNTEFELVQRSYKHFLKRLNHRCFGNRARRYNKQVQIVGVLEGYARGSVLHYHCAALCPNHISEELFQKYVAECWARVGFAGHQVRINPLYSDGWAGYSSQSAVFLDRTSIDWDNAQLSEVLNS